MILHSMPDAKQLKQFWEVAKDYPILGSIGNGVIVHPEGLRHPMVLLRSRFYENGETDAKNEP